MLYKEDIISVAEFPVLETTRQQLAEKMLSSLPVQETLDTVGMPLIIKPAAEKKQHPATLFFANTNFIVKSRYLLPRLRGSAITIVNDGVGMDIAAWLLRGKAFKENLNGTDFTPYLLLQAKRPLKIFLLGGKRASVTQAAEYARLHLGQNVVGICDGYAGIKNHPDLVAWINETGAELVLVALGNPIQEEWILQHRDALNAGIVMGVGALFDFWAGDKPRAPMLIQSLRLEWLYRLSLEPRRLLRRYTIDILTFLRHCLKYR